MSVDLSRSIEQAFRKALDRADGLRAAGQMREASAVYREAAVLARQLERYAVSPAEKKRRRTRGDELQAFARRILEEKPASAPAENAAAATDADELQSQIDKLVTRSEVGWNDIAGLEEMKRELQVAFGVAMAQKPAGVRIDVVNNVLLYGPPGTGKSILAAAVSNGLSATFFNVAASSLLSKWFGESSRLVSALYETARRRAPVVVFMDELECLFPSRNAARSGAEHQVLATLLAEISGMATSGAALPVFTIGATNTPWLLDAAAMSRFGRRIYVPLPDAATRRRLLELHWDQRGHRTDFSVDRVVEASDGLSGRQLSQVAAKAIENMLAVCNADLAEFVAQGKPAEQYQLCTRPLQWSDVALALARTKPETSPETLRRFAEW